MGGCFQSVLVTVSVTGDVAPSVSAAPGAEQVGNSLSELFLGIFPPFSAAVWDLQGLESSFLAGVGGGWGVTHTTPGALTRQRCRWRHPPGTALRPSTRGSPGLSRPPVRWEQPRGNGAGRRLAWGTRGHDTRPQVTPQGNGVGRGEVPPRGELGCCGAGGAKAGGAKAGSRPRLPLLPAGVSRHREPPGEPRRALGCRGEPGHFILPPPPACSDGKRRSCLSFPIPLQRWTGLQPAPLARQPPLSPPLCPAGGRGRKRLCFLRSLFWADLCYSFIPGGAGQDACPIPSELAGLPAGTRDAAHPGDGCGGHTLSPPRPPDRLAESCSCLPGEPHAQAAAAPAQPGPCLSSN